MRDVKIGTTVIDGSGNATTVLGIFPQGKRDTYRVSFNDGSFTYCSDEHLWEVFTNDFKERHILTTLQIKDILNSNDNLYQLNIKTPKISTWEESNMAYNGIGPYSMGYMFGAHEYSLFLNHKSLKRQQINALKSVCKQMHMDFNGDLINTWKNLKHNYIPKEYLFTSKTNREYFLKGFLDANNISDDNTIAYIHNKKMSDCISFLVRSLGGFDYISKRADGSSCHTIDMSGNSQRAVIAVEYVGKKKCQCILVSSPEHTYLTNDLIVTHNTQVVVYSLCYDLYKLMCLKNPSRFYGLGEDTIYLFFFNLTLKLSERTAYARFQRALQSSPWFMSRGTISGKKYLEYVPDKNIRFDKGSNLEHALGSACFAVIMDEMSFGKNDDANYQLSKMMEIYNQLHVRLGSRFNMNRYYTG